MNNPFEYFDNIYVISAKDSERRPYIREKLGRLNIEFNFFDAVMGNNLSEDEIEAIYDDEAAKKHKTIKRSLRKPEIGCTLSHLCIYEKIVSENMDNALIFEDDIAPDVQNIKLIENAIKELPDNWDLLHLGVWDHYKEPPWSFKLKLLFYFPFLNIFAPHKMEYNYRHLKNLYPRKYSKHLKKPGFHLGTQAYTISNSGAQKMLAYREKIVTVIDMFISVMVVENRLNAFMIKEKVFSQNKGFKSIIQNI